MSEITLYRVREEYVTTLKDGVDNYKAHNGEHALHKVSFHKDSLRALCANLLNKRVLFSNVEMIIEAKNMEQENHGDMPDIVEIGA